jgi:putative ABC transport system permease protein
MKNYLLKNIGKSFLYYRKDYINQIIIISLLAAIITGSLLTGDSVRESLKKSSNEKLGNTFILVSSGLRYFDSSLSERLLQNYKIKTTSILETDGYCQNFTTGATSLNINIYGINEGFFRFHGIDSFELQSGTVAINSAMARHLGVIEGDEIIIRFREADPIPANAPFAPSEESNNSLVLKISKILGPEQAGNFSLGINQIVPQNLFLNLKDLQMEGDSTFRVNRMLVAYNDDLTESSLSIILKEILIPSDIGLSIRKSKLTDESEIISDRIFIDSSIVGSVINNLPGGYPVITYLANSLKTENSEAPYSFVSGLPLNSEIILNNDEIVISRWLAQDLNAKPGNELTLRWFHPVGNLLEEQEKKFIIRKIVEIEGWYSDPTLMPEFPGISGKATCTSWDAGIPILMNKIREKDEAYWNIYKGTPKAFVNYETGRKLWGNIFGPATSVRFPKEIDKTFILNTLRGKFDPFDAGFTVKNVRMSGEEAANQGVDFSTLFLSLSFFIILSCILLLSFSVSMFFESKKEQVRTYYAIGFRNRIISKLLFMETSMISFTGAVMGIFLGYGVNLLIINALNSVWNGAVQTSTITPDFSLIPVMTGFIATVLIAQILVMLKLRIFLRRLAQKGEKGFELHSPRINFVLLILTTISAISVIAFSLFVNDTSIVLSFTGGILLFGALVIAIRQFYLGGFRTNNTSPKGIYGLSRRFYSFNPSQSVAPVIFIAAGIFAIIITGSNRQDLTEEMLLNKGGTGGYLFWAETAIPVKQNLNSADGRKEFGLKDPEFGSLEILQCQRLAGDDASCLNLNHIKAPPVLGLDPSYLVQRMSFSFASFSNAALNKDPWSLLAESTVENTIYGIADETVLKWGLKISVGDTLVFRSETGMPFNIIICAGLKSSVFQGHLIIGEKNFRNYFPSVSGSSVFLFDSNQKDNGKLKSLLSDRFSSYGPSIDLAADKLASFFIVTNTYLNVFTILGILGLILGVAGLGFILIRNYYQRRKEFALMLATGYTSNRIRNYIMVDQVIVLICGIITGTASALIATVPSLASGDAMSFNLLIIMIVSVFFTGLTIMFISVRRVQKTNLVLQLKKD